MISRRQAIAGAVVAPLFLQAASSQAAEPRAQASPPTIDEFLKPAIDRDVALSPNGKQIAILSARTDGERTIASVTIMDADNPEKTAVIQIGELDVETVAWANNQRLLIRIRYDLAPKRRDAATGTLLPPKPGSNKISVRRMFAIDTDGRRGVMLFKEGLFDADYIYDLSLVVDTLPDDPRHVLMHAWQPTTSVAILCKVDVETGAAEIVERGTAKTWMWLTQNGAPVVRYDTNPRGTVTTIYLRAPGAADWTFFRKLRRDDWAKQEFWLLGPASEPGVMLTYTYLDGQDVLAIRKLDLRTMALGEVVASHPGRDIENVIVAPDGRVLGSRYIDDRVAYQFADPKMTAHFRGLNKYLKDACNIDIVDVSLDANRYLARVTGPQEAGAFYYYDSAAKRFGGIGQCRPWLTRERLATVETLSVRTRDGAAVTAYLTVPLASGPRPLVVMPHGGPEARDQVDFDDFAQVLAAQGWMVLQPNFRGSDGYGKAFAQAGRKHWGDRMQEDVEDALAQVLATGRVDKTKVAICGASYGGYAALMGAVRNPDLYKAVVSIAGVSDLFEAIAFVKSEDGADSASYLYWLGTIGDPAGDHAMMEMASPARRADKVNAPVLLIHGLDDSIVSPRQSQIMAKALRNLGKPVELIEMKGVGHRNLRPDNWRTVFERSVDHIGEAFKA